MCLLCIQPLCAPAAQPVSTDVVIREYVQKPDAAAKPIKVVARLRLLGCALALSAFHLTSAIAVDDASVHRIENVAARVIARLWCFLFGAFFCVG